MSRLRALEEALRDIAGTRGSLYSAVQWEKVVLCYLLLIERKCCVLQSGLLGEVKLVVLVQGWSCATICCFGTPANVHTIAYCQPEIVAYTETA